MLAEAECWCILLSAHEPATARRISTCYRVHPYFFQEYEMRKTIQRTGVFFAFMIFALAIGIVPAQP